jgi:hypothetical protein
VKNNPEKLDFSGLSDTLFLRMGDEPGIGDQTEL